MYERTETGIGVEPVTTAKVAMAVYGAGAGRSAKYKSILTGFEDQLLDLARAYVELRKGILAEGGTLERVPHFDVLDAHNAAGPSISGQTRAAFNIMLGAPKGPTAEDSGISGPELGGLGIFGRKRKKRAGAAERAVEVVSGQVAALGAQYDQLLQEKKPAAAAILPELQAAGFGIPLWGVGLVLGWWIYQRFAR